MAAPSSDERDRRRKRPQTQFVRTVNATVQRNDLIGPFFVACGSPSSAESRVKLRKRRGGTYILVEKSVSSTDGDGKCVSQYSTFQ